MLYISSHLSAYNRNTRMLKYFQVLQNDPEPAIRTNSVICICKILSTLDERGQKEIATPIIAKSLSDEKNPLRDHILKSILSSIKQMKPEIICNAILPNVTPLLLSSDNNLRIRAAEILQKSQEALINQQENKTEDSQNLQKSNKISLSNQSSKSYNEKTNNEIKKERNVKHKNLKNNISKITETLWDDEDKNEDEDEDESFENSILFIYS